MHEAQDTTRLAAYVFVAAICMLGAFRQPASRRATQLTLLGVAVIALAVAFAESVNLGERVSDVFRRIAGEEGLYDGRRPLQALVVVIISAVGIVMTAVAARVAWRADRRLMPVVLLGLASLTLIVVRTVSLHQVDRILYEHAAGDLHLGTVIEILVALALAAWVAASFILIPAGTRRDTAADRH